MYCSFCNSHSIIEHNGSYVCTDCGNVFGEIYSSSTIDYEPFQETSVLHDYIQNVLDDFDLPNHLVYNVIESYKKVSNKLMDKKCIMICIHQVSLEQCNRVIQLELLFEKYGINTKHVEKIKNKHFATFIENKFISHIKFCSNSVNMSKRDTQLCLKFIPYVDEIMRAPKTIIIGLILYLSKHKKISIDINFKDISKKTRCSINTIKACYNDIQSTLKDTIL
jgi:hypothetical protein